MSKRRNHRMIAAIAVIGGCLFAFAAEAAGQTIRFSPGQDAPIALNPTTRVYEEGASFDPLVCAEQPCIELLHNIFEPLVAVSSDRRIEPCLAISWERRDEVTFRFQLRHGVTVSLGHIGISLTVKRVAESEFLEQIYLPKFTGGGPPSFDILLLSVPAGTIFHAAMVPMTLLYSREPSESVIRDRQVDDLYLAAIRAYEPDAARRAWQRLEQYATSNYLLFVGYQERAVFGANAQLRFTPAR
jgi:hypothetical protein